jgi:hypothetical protein
MRLQEILNEAQANLFQSLCNDFGFFISFNLSKVSIFAVDKNAATELLAMQQRFRQSAINGKTFSDAVGDAQIMNDPKGRAAMLKWIHSMLLYIEPRIHRFVNDAGKQLWLPRLEKLKKEYTDLVNKQ